MQRVLASGDNFIMISFGKVYLQATRELWKWMLLLYGFVIEYYIAVFEAACA